MFQDHSIDYFSVFKIDKDLNVPSIMVIIFNGYFVPIFEIIILSWVISIII